MKALVISVLALGLVVSAAPATYGITFRKNWD